MGSPKIGNGHVHPPAGAAAVSGSPSDLAAGMVNLRRNAERRIASVGRGNVKGLAQALDAREALAVVDAAPPATMPSASPALPSDRRMFSGYRSSQSSSSSSLGVASSSASANAKGPAAAENENMNAEDKRHLLLAAALEKSQQPFVPVDHPAFAVQYYDDEDGEFPDQVKRCPCISAQPLTRRELDTELPTMPATVKEQFLRMRTFKWTEVTVTALARITP